MSNPYESDDWGQSPPCHLCGADSVWSPTIAEGNTLVERPLCGNCTDDQTTICPTCHHRIYQMEGVRVFKTADLYCKSCAKPWVAGAAEEASRADVDRDDAMRRG